MRSEEQRLQDVLGYITSTTIAVRRMAELGDLDGAREGLLEIEEWMAEARQILGVLRAVA